MLMRKPHGMGVACRCSDDGSTVESWKSRAVARFNPANNRGTAILAAYVGRCTYDRYYFWE